MLESNGTKYVSFKWLVPILISLLLTITGAYFVTVSAAQTAANNNFQNQINDNKTNDAKLQQEIDQINQNVASLQASMASVQTTLQFQNDYFKRAFGIK